MYVCVSCIQLERERVHFHFKQKSTIPKSLQATLRKNLGEFDVPALAFEPPAEGRPHEDSVCLGLVYHCVFTTCQHTSVARALRVE